MNLDNFHARRNILESVVLLQGTIHELHQEKKKGGDFQDRFWERVWQSEVTFLISDTRNARFLSQTDNLGGILHFKWQCSCNVNDNVGHFSKQERP